MIEIRAYKLEDGSIFENKAEAEEAESKKALMEGLKLIILEEGMESSVEQMALHFGNKADTLRGLLGVKSVPDGALPDVEDIDFKDMRERKNITIQQLSEAVGVEAEFIFQIERSDNTSALPYHIVRSLLEALK